MKGKLRSIAKWYPPILAQNRKIATLFCGYLWSQKGFFFKFVFVLSDMRLTVSKLSKLTYSAHFHFSRQKTVVQSFSLILKIMLKSCVSRLVRNYRNKYDYFPVNHLN